MEKLPKKNNEPPLGYELIEDGAKVVFVFDEQNHTQSAVRTVNVAGTFNQWTVSADWQLTQTAKGLWQLTVPAAKALIPGNSGYAEFTFVVNGSNQPNPLSASLPGYSFKGNNLIVLPGEDIERIVTNETIARTRKGPEDFDLNNEEDRKTIANFRLVPGTNRLFRSYNPCRESKPYDAEIGRLPCVNGLLEASEVKSIISISGPYGNPPEYSISPYVQAIVDTGHFLPLEPTYDSVYYQSDSAEFGHQIREIVEFIINPAHQGPFLVHCRIGTDRTGVVSAIIAGLCGATWERICVDYQKSNEVGMEEYRDIKLLRYSFANMLKKKIDPETDLKTVLSAYFVNKGYLQLPQIESLNRKLKDHSRSAVAK